jgi:probable F420-dependent oxidoreductase
MTHARRFRFGVIIEQAHTPEAWLALARRAESLGYATFLIRDHFAPDFFGDQLAPFSALATAAAVTTRLRVGTMVIDNDYRHPVVLAKEAATLDALSGGRLELGLGAGWLRREYEQAGLPFDAPGVRVSRLEESIQILKGLFGPAPVDFAGAHYRIEGLRGFPAPAQRPHPPLLIGAGSPRMLRLAGREADIVGVLTSSTRTGTLVADPAERLAAAVEEKLERVREGAGSRFPEIELSLIADLTVTDRRAEAVERLIEARQWQDVKPADVLAMPATLMGSHEEVAATIAERRERFGFSYYVVPDRALEAFAPVVAALAGR